MRLTCHYCRSTFCNCYVIRSDVPESKEHKLPLEAIIIDPGEMDVSILNYIEENEYTLKGVFITHDHRTHVKGLAAIMRIYDTTVYAVNPVVGEYATTLVKDGTCIHSGQFKVEVITVPGHSADSAVFKIDHLLFTGDAMSAGLVGSTANSYAEATLVNTLRSKILSLPGDFTILPGHGPPSTLKAERRFNVGINSFTSQQNRRPVFRIEF